VKLNEFLPKLQSGQTNDRSEMKNNAITVDTVVGRAAGVVDAEIDNGVVALKIDTGMCYGLNEVGSDIWRFLSTPISVSEMCSKLRGMYSIDSASCERQVIDLLEELRAEELIKPLFGSSDGNYVRAQSV
jgi:Coenzyme PQQ synthesis protein D (PqqD)